MVKMNGALRAPPLTAPPGLAERSSRRASPKGACPPLLILGGCGCRNASHRAIDFPAGTARRTFSPQGAFTLPEGGRNMAQFEPYFDGNLHQIEGSFDNAIRGKIVAIHRLL